MVRKEAGSGRGVAVIAHRAGRGAHPENTMHAASAAIRLGVDGIEIDLGMSRDGQLVVNHDRALRPDITRDAQGCWIEEPVLISALELEELQRYRVGQMRPGSAYAARFPRQREIPDGEPLPSLRRMLSGPLAELPARSTLMLEIKTSPEAPQETASPMDFIAALTEELDRAQLRCRVAVASFDWRNLALARELIPNASRIFISARQPRLNTVDPVAPGMPSPWLAGRVPGPGKYGLVDLVAELGGHVWAPDYHDIDAGSVAAAHGCGLRVYAWTVNGKRGMETVAAMGVDALITDYPKRAIKMLAAARAPAG